ncbi:MAG: glycogen debranching protein GlgX [Syntrophobacterales bacterium]|nr:glycogen debranching protein GlgX [Syntrophobacterales bacterium]
MKRPERLTLCKGKPYPLGATWDGEGVNFAIFSENAERVELCLFDSIRAFKESVRIEMPEYTGGVWHVYLPGIGPGQLYGYRVYGPYDPERGFRFNPAKVLIDPYAKLVVRTSAWHETWFGYKTGFAEADLYPDTRDNAPYAPLSVVVDDRFDWEDDKHPEIPWNQTIIYETHVRGMTMLHPSIPSELRGTFLGLCSEPIIKHLKDLGITAIELMPVHQHIDEYHLVKHGLTNYWGYSTISYFAPDTRFGCLCDSTDLSRTIRDFKTMVKTFHAHGIEVILDVVYNHTGEGSHLGPTLCYRGIDNLVYYRLREENKRFYIDFTGCGNTLNVTHPRVLQLIMDSLRYWIIEMHVDGFRFDLATTLARDPYEFNRFSAFFALIQQDPVISRVKLIAEPWDLGPVGYRIGDFPDTWAEWNGKYRDGIRAFWNMPYPSVMKEFSLRVSGSRDLYRGRGRKTFSSINYITCHDGFTLQDLVSYNRKHNEANKEENRDGDSHNLSFNFGVEGPTLKREILEIRYRQKRNLMATLMFSIGVPMILGGDELGRTQGGNNNAYCQDNTISWYSWRLEDRDKDFLEFVRRVIAVRRSQPLFQRSNFFKDRDLMWFTPSGRRMTEGDWENPETTALGVIFGKEAVAGETDECGKPIVGEVLLLMVNPLRDRTISFTLPHYDSRRRHFWELILDTIYELGFPPEKKRIKAGNNYELNPLSLALFRCVS